MWRHDLEEKEKAREEERRRHFKNHEARTRMIRASGKPARTLLQIKKEHTCEVLRS
jgi:hypothetical protein